MFLRTKELLIALSRGILEVVPIARCLVALVVVDGLIRSVFPTVANVLWPGLEIVAAAGLRWRFTRKLLANAVPGSWAPLQVGAGRRV